jgi:hypothetical protein
MKRLSFWSVVIVACALVAPVLRADVKTREKTLVKFEGVLGGAFKLFGGSAAKDGVTSTVAVKGVRKSSVTDTTGEIIDLSEEKVYRLDVKKKEYRVVTFAQLRKEWEDAKAEAQKNAEEMKKGQPEQEPPDRELEFTADVKETGQTKSIAGYDTREVVLTITGQEKGKTLEQGGGFVMTSTMWMAPHIAALDEIGEFDVKFIKAVYGGDMAAQARDLAAAFAMFPSAQPMMLKMSEAGTKLEGTPLETTTVFESVKSDEQMKQAQSQQSSGGGGLTGRLASRMMGGAGQPKQRSTVFTTVHNVLSVEAAASDADVAIPAAFKEKK